MVVMVFRRMASVTAPSKLGGLHLVHFPSSPLDPAGALPALGTPPESTGGEDKVLTIETRFLYNHEDPFACQKFSQGPWVPGPTQTSTSI